MPGGDGPGQAARQKLIEHNLRLVAHIIKKYYASQNDQEDLISIGTIGLIKAIDTFDPAKGIRLSSYASRCIENEILMFFRSGRKSAQDVSLNEPIDTDKEGNALTILDTMAVDDTIVESIDTKMKSEKLYRFLQSSLTPREREVVCRRYGLLGFAPQPQRVVAKRLGISRSYISRIEKKALETLRRQFQQERLLEGPCPFPPAGGIIPLVFAKKEGESQGKQRRNTWCASAAACSPC